MTESTPFIYPVRSAKPRPGLQDRWEGAAWRHVPALPIAHFRPESSSHRPNTQVRLEALPKIKQRINSKAQQLLEDIDASFSENEADDNEESLPVSIGIYFYQNKQELDQENDQ